MFSTDNGGDVTLGGNNHPLRGDKGSLYEGGTRGVGFVAGGVLSRRRALVNELIHITDWYPTLLAAAGGAHLLHQDLDGINQWDVLDRGAAAKRSEMVYNLRIAPLSGAFRVGPHKLIFGRDFKKNNWYDIDTVMLPRSCSLKDGGIIVTKTIVRIKGDFAKNLSN